MVTFLEISYIERTRDKIQINTLTSKGDVLFYQADFSSESTSFEGCYSVLTLSRCGSGYNMIVSEDQCKV